MPHTCNLEVRFRDIDKLGHVNNAVYLSYFEQARVHFIDEVLENKVDWDKQGLILANTEVSFLSPILLKDKIQVETTCTKIGNKSFTLSYRIFTKEGNKATGSSVLVCFDYTTKTSVAVPTAWKQLLEKFIEKKD